MRHLNILAGDIGCRPIGTPQNHAAADYIAQAFRQARLAVETQEFACPDWSAESARLESRGETFDVYANTFSPSCDVSGAIVPLGTVAELEMAEMQGCLPLFYGDLAQNSIGALHAIYISPRDHKILRLLAEKMPAALLTVHPSLHHRWRLVEDFDLSLPSATVLAKDGLKLAQRSGEQARLILQTRRRESVSGNVVGRLVETGNERLVLCAHYDSKEDTPGAYDNAAGVAILLTLAEVLGKTRPRITLEFVAFSGEEIYGLGDMTYARLNGDDFSPIQAAINLDGVGPRLSTNTVATFSCNEPFDALVDGLIAQYPGVVRVNPWPASDHYIFYSHGVPSIALTSHGIKDIFHTPEDHVGWISPEKLVEATRLTLDLVQALQKKPARWGRL